MFNSEADLGFYGRGRGCQPLCGSKFLRIGVVNQAIGCSRFLMWVVATLSLKWGAQLKKKDAYKVYYVNIETMGRNPHIVYWFKRGG